MRNNLLTFPSDCAIWKSSILKGAAPASEHQRHDATGGFVLGLYFGPSCSDTVRSGAHLLGVDTARAFFCARSKQRLHQKEVHQ